MTEPLVVAVLFPADLDTSLVLEHAAGCVRSLEVLSGHYQESHELLNERGRGRPREEFEHLIPEVDQQTKSLLARAEVIMTRDVPVDLVELAPSLRVVQGVGAGVGHLNVPWLAANGIRVANGAGVQAPPIAEFVLARLLEVWKDLRHFEDNQRARVWERHRAGLVEGRTLGIVGMGAIGSAVAKRAKAFDLRVIATRRSYQPGMTAAFVDELMGPQSLARLLRESDAVLLSVPLTEETTEMIGPEQLAMMKPDAVLCNVARGGLVDEQALIEALSSGHLGAAVLDVTKAEPLPSDSPLYDAPNLYISPHSSTSDEGMSIRLAQLLGGNLVRYAAGERLINERDPALGY